MTTAEILKNVSDAVAILTTARMNREIADLRACYIPLIHAENHIQAELTAMVSDSQAA